MLNSYVMHPKEFKDFNEHLPWFDVSPRRQLLMTTEEFATLIERECQRSHRFQQHFSLVTFKIKAKDKASNYLLQILTKRLRTSDVAGWINHEYIGILLLDTALRHKVDSFIESIRQLVSQQAISLPEHHIHIYPHDWQVEKYPLKIKKITTYQRDTKQQTAIQSPINLLEVAPTTTPVFHRLFPRGMPWWKRTIDIIGATLGLLVLLPLLAVVAIYIKMVSPGPIFFRQPRAGYLGKSFIIWKFRTMQVNVNVAEHQKYISELLKTGKPMIKLESGDPQIIPHGNLLRKTGIDELPQLINVLRGEMSLVGPRPDVFYAVKNYKPWYHARSDAYPGLTGLWQVSGKNNISYEEMMRLDIKYARNISFWLDVKILLLTPITLVQQVVAHLKTRKTRQKNHVS